MKIYFNHEIEICDLSLYVKSIGWDDCMSFQDGCLEYSTKSWSAGMTLNSNGSGDYSGQRSLLFSHAVFSCIPREYLKGNHMDFIHVESTDPDRHPLEYSGRCYMEDLRDEIRIKMGLVPIFFHDFSQKVTGDLSANPLEILEGLGLMEKNFLSRDVIKSEVKKHFHHREEVRINYISNLLQAAISTQMVSG